MDAERLRKRTKDFAHRCVKLSLALPEDYLGRHIKRQLIRCATSVAANYRAVCLAQSKPDFVAKLSVAVEEANECIFWIEFAVEENLVGMKAAALLLNEARELTAIFVAARKSARNRSSEFIKPEEAQNNNQ